MGGLKLCRGTGEAWEGKGPAGYKQTSTRETDKMENYKLMTGIALLAMTVMAFNGFAETKNPSAAPSAEATTAVVMAEGVPGGIIIDTLTLDAEVVAVDHEARTAVLLMPGGEQVPITVGPEAINFDQVQKGDRVKALVTEELAIYLGDEDSAEADGAGAAAVLAGKGEQPGGIVAETARATATVTAIDLEAHTATLQFDDGGSKTVNVRPDVDLSQQKVGSKVVFEVTRMVAISVEKQ
jgi:Cu/Ag efflux protein CusF